MLRLDTNKRLFFIDALKAFAIILVVLGHLSQFSPLQDHIYGRIVTIFHMPLFMAVSGYVTNPERIHIHKRMRLLIPFLVFGLGWTFLNNGTIFGFLTDEAKYGYWYLTVLLTFCMLLFLLNRIQMRLEYGMLVVELLLGTLHLAFHHSVVATTLSTNHMFQLWPFFCLGILLRKGLLEKLLVYKKWVSLSFILIVAVILWGGQQYALTGTLKEYLNDFCSVFIVAVLFMLFACMEDLHIRNRLVSLIGRSTLQIYVLHYFMLMLSLKVVGGGYVLPFGADILAAPLYALLVAMLCILVSKALHGLGIGFLFGR